MSRFTKIFIVAALMFLLSVGCARNQIDDGEILVFAAASLADVLADIEESFEKVVDVDLMFSYGGSQLLAQQIASGAPADVFLAAGDAPVDFLSRMEVPNLEIWDLLTNKLVVATRGDLGFALSSLEQLDDPRIDRVAIAAPDLAPAGAYAREALKSMKLWKKLESKMIFGADVSVTLAYVESGNADVGIVYLTDTYLTPKVVALDVVPQWSYSTVIYPVVAIDRAGPNQKAIDDFLGFLRSNEARDIFENNGFHVAKESP